MSERKERRIKLWRNDQQRELARSAMIGQQADKAATQVRDVFKCAGIDERSKLCETAVFVVRSIVYELGDKLK
jgi:hypothetical protein